MIIFLYGQNSYNLIQYVRELTDRYRKKYPGSFNFHRFDLEEADISKIENAIKGVSFFKEVKFVVVKNPFAKPALLEKTIKENPEVKSLASYGAGAIAKEKDTVLLLYQSEAEEELKKKGPKLFELLKKESQAKEFKPVTAPAAAKFASDRLIKNKISLKKELLAKLLKETGPDLWRIENELQKIAAYSKHPEVEPSAHYGARGKKEITEEELTKLVNFNLDYNIFAITDAAFFDHSSAMRLLEDYFSKGGDPSYLISMLAFQLKNLIMVRELMDKKMQYSEILKKTNMHPFVFKKNYETAKKYTLDQLKTLFRKLAEFEVSFKNGSTQAEDVFFKVFL